MLLQSDIEVHAPHVARTAGGPAPGLVLAGVLLGSGVVALLIWLAASA